MENKKFSSNQILFIIILGIALGIRQMAMTMVMPFITIFSKSLNYYTPTLAGIALGVFGLTQAIFQIPFGILSDKYGKKIIILIGLMQVIVGLIIAYFATNMYMLILARGIQGSGAIIAVAYAWIAIVVEEDKRTHAIGIISMIIGVAAALSFALGPIIHRLLEVDQMFLTCAIIISISWICILLFLKEKKVQWNPETTIHIENSNVKDKKRTKNSPTNINEIKEGMKILMENRSFIILNLLAFFNNYIMVAVFFIVPQYLVPIVTIDGMWRVFLPSVVIAILAMRGLLASKAAKLYKLVITLAFLFSALGISLFFKPGFYFLLLGTIIFMTGYMFITTLIPSKANEITEDSYRGAGNGILNSFQYVGSFIGSLITGLLWEVNPCLAIGGVVLACVISTFVGALYL